MKKIKIYSRMYKTQKWRGIVDYRVGAFLIGYVCAIYQLLSYIGLSVTYILYVILMSCIPLFGIYVVVGKEENVPHILYNILQYIVRHKNYIFYYDKED